jgi:hypothetical protein
MKLEIAVSTHFADRFSESARRYVARIGSLYERARALVAGTSPEHRPMAAWDWHSTSAQACVEEAVLIYIEGLEILLSEPVEVRSEEESGALRFICLPMKGAAGTSFEAVDGAIVANSDEAKSAVEHAFGPGHREVLTAFADGLQRLHALGAFGRSNKLKLQPDVSASADAALSDPGGMAHR